jgi:hypothetical protein
MRSKYATGRQTGGQRRYKNPSKHCLFAPAAEDRGQGEIGRIVLPGVGPDHEMRDCPKHHVRSRHMFI